MCQFIEKSDNFFSRYGNWKFTVHELISQYFIMFGVLYLGR